MVISIPENLQSSSWVFANEKQAGFYRVHYDDNLRKALQDNVNQLLPSERLGLQNDWFALSFANQMDISSALELATKYVEEDNYAVWADLADNLDSLLTLWEEEPSSNILSSICKDIFVSSLNRIGWENQEGESDLRVLHRALMMKYAGALGDDKMIKLARSMFQDHINQVNQIHPDQQGLVFQIVMKFGGESEFNQLMDLYKRTESTEGKVRILRALAVSPTEELVRKALELSISNDVRPQDTFYAFVSTSGSSKGRDIAWRFLKENWEIFVDKFADGQFLFPRIITYATKFQSYSMADEVEEFFKNHPVSFQRTLSQNLESIRAKANWLDLQRESFTTFLKNY